MKDRRKALRYGLLGGTFAVVLPSKWAKPIVNSVILPAHAQTSACTVETINESITIQVSATQIEGPITLARNGNSFNGTESRDVGACGTNQRLTVLVEFSGTINSNNNEITGELTIRQSCGTDLVSEQISTYRATQSPAQANNDEGNYSGTVTGTLETCS